MAASGTRGKRPFAVFGDGSHVGRCAMVAWYQPRIRRIDGRAAGLLSRAHGETAANKGAGDLRKSGDDARTKSRLPARLGRTTLKTASCRAESSEVGFSRYGLRKNAEEPAVTLDSNDARLFSQT